MATNSYLVFFNSSGVPAVNEVASNAPTVGNYPFPTPKLQPTNYFEIFDWDLSSVQTLNIGSQSTGAGAGKIMFNPLTVSRAIDHFSQTLFLNECSGLPFKYVDLLVKKSGGTTSAFYLAYRFGLCAVNTIEWSDSSSGDIPQEKVSFQYGQLTTAYAVQDQTGKIGPYTLVGWDRVRNVKI